MDPKTAERILFTGGAIGFLVAILGIVGELLGWWNDVGQLLTTLGSVAGLALTGSGIVLNADRGQAQAILDGQSTTHDQLASMDARLESVDGKLESMGGKLDSVDGKLDKLDELDVIQAELDRQTGALDRQIEVLEQIRDSV